MKNRSIRAKSFKKFHLKHSRILVLTGARQTGKTTLAREAFSDLPYISVEDPVLRPLYTRMSSTEWIENYPLAIIDEVQKAPALIESLKAAHDRDKNVRYLLLGSSQILLLSKVKESLAGRVSVEELWPLTLPEMITSSWDDPVPESRLVSWLKGDPRSPDPLLGLAAENRSFVRMQSHFDRYLRFGGMPVVHDPEITEEECEEWLKDYQRTYLERDVSDLAALRDLEPFVLAQKAIATRTGRLVNFSDLARTANITPSTAKRFIRYLELSYQIILLPPYYRNPEKRLTKMPKIHMLDPGVLRSIVGRKGQPTGEEFESAVVAEIFKQCRNADLPVEFYHLHTHDGREVDLVFEMENGFVAMEIKMTSKVHDTDTRPLRNLDQFFDKPVLNSLILSMDHDARKLSDGTMALPIVWALSPLLNQ